MSKTYHQEDLVMRKQRSVARHKRILGAGVASILLLASLNFQAQAAEEKAQDFSLTVMAFNIWNNGIYSKMWDEEARKNGELVYTQTMQDLLRGVAPDVLVTPELYNNNGKELNGKSVVEAHIEQMLALLNEKENKLGDYEKINGIPAHDMIFSSADPEFMYHNTVRIKPGNGFPDTVIAGRHFTYHDAAQSRNADAKEAVDLAQSTNVPTILLGDLNAGDISERGLLSIDAQLRVIKSADGNGLYRDLARQYVAQADADIYRQIIQNEYVGQDIDSLSWNQWGLALEKAYQAGTDIGLKDETYPVDSNLPLTMNMLKQQYQLMQLERNREQFKPSEVDDGRATWTSDGEEATNTWASWDRANIDHIMVSRPFAKWVEIVDNGEWSGTLSDPATLPNGNSLSDHEPIAQELRWVGPKLETYQEDGAEKTRLVWGAGASNFTNENKEFYLTRNNNRNDVYLGQIADENGNPILTGLTLEEKKTLLDCASSDPRFAQAVKDYCIDNHDFIGQTLVTDGGTVIVDEDAALGKTAAQLHLAGGGLRIAGQSMDKLDRNVVLNGHGWIDVADGENSVIAAQSISGDGGLIKRGAGVLELGTANSYQGGTIVEDGVLRAGAAGALVGNSDYTVNGGTLDLNGHDLTMASLSGQGGAVELASATLEVNQNANHRYDGIIQGSGDLVKSGSGVLLLNGENSYQGATSVTGGGLIVGDADHTNATINGLVSVSEGGFIGGAGTLGGLTLAKGAVLAPGNSVGTLKVDGDLTMQVGALYQAEIDTQGGADLVQVSGTATIHGADVFVEKAGGTYIANSRYTILSAQGGINGTFANLDQNKPFLDMNLVYDPSTVYLDVLRNDVSFESVAQTSNQRSVAASVETLGIGNAVYDAVVSQSGEAQARTAYDLLSGEIHASAKTALINSSADLRNATQDRIRSAFGDAGMQNGTKVAGEKDAPAALWVQSYGTWSKNSSDDNATTMDQTTTGVFAGYDAEIGENVRLGALAGYSRTSFDVDSRASSGSSNNYHVGLYGGSRWGNTSLSGGVAYSAHSVDTSRSVWFTGLAEQLNADYHANTVQVYGEISHKLQAGGAVFEPFANLAYVHLKTDGFTESGGQAALRFDENTQNVTFSTLGLRAVTQLMLGSVQTNVTGVLGWQHGYGDVESADRAAFATGTAFDVSGIPVAKDSALVQLGFDFKASEQATLGVSYKGQFGSGVQSNSVNAKLGIKF